MNGVASYKKVLVLDDEDRGCEEFEEGDDIVLILEGWNEVEGTIVSITPSSVTLLNIYDDDNEIEINLEDIIDWE